MALDGQLEDNKGVFDKFVVTAEYWPRTDETIFAIIVETKDDLEPTTNSTTDGVSVSNSLQKMSSRYKYGERGFADIYI